ncbi:MAG: NAD(P)-dependent oxidoreductase [Chloroflexota bacterium]
MSFKAALIDRNLDTVPKWVPGALANEGIDLVAKRCQTNEEMIEIAKDADILWVYGGTRLATKENMSQLTNCRAAIRSGSGVDVIDVDGATELGMVVVNVPHAHNDAVSDHTIALLFSMGRYIIPQDKLCRTEEWSSPRRHEFLPFWRLREKTIGLLGFGLIPRYVVKKLSGFEPNWLAYDPYVDDATLAEHGVERTELDDLLQRSDIVSVHTPLTNATRHLIGERELKLMKSDALLINTARGPVIEEAALVRALTENWIRGAGLDVFEVEPTTPDNPLMALDNVVVTPHTAGFSDESVELTWRLSVEACIDLKAGVYPRSYVNKSVTPRVPMQTKTHGEIYTPA